VLAELKTWLWSQAGLKILFIGKGGRVRHRNWDRLSRFTSDPQIPLENNSTERGIGVPSSAAKITTARTHALELRSRIAATLYTLVETAKLHHVAPTRYLLEGVRAAVRGEVLMPWRLTADEPSPALAP
jgi:transposase